jgi:type IV pilus assembly protein PilN
MIKINLLLVRGAKKKETVRQQIIILILFLVVTVAIMGGIYSYLLGKISSTKAAITQAESEIQQLKAKIGQIENLKKLEEEVRKKLDVLTQLRVGKTGPVKRLAALSDAVPDKVWLTRYTENGESVSIGGIAYTEELIADFMRNLEASQQYYQVELLVSEQVDVSGVKAKRFDLTCKLGAPKKEEPKPQQPPKK